MRQNGYTITAVARAIGRDKSVVSRELRGKYEVRMRGREADALVIDFYFAQPYSLRSEGATRISNGHHRTLHPQGRIARTPNGEECNRNSAGGSTASLEKGPASKRPSSIFSITLQPKTINGRNGLHLQIESSTYQLKENTRKAYRAYPYAFLIHSTAIP